LRRVTGPDGKLVNLLTDIDAVATSAKPAHGSEVSSPHAATHIEAEPCELPAGSSHEQRVAERVMLRLLVARLDVQLKPARITVPSGAHVEVDGADAERRVLVECWAHQGTPKVAQKNKVLADAFKLTWIASTINPRPRLILCLADPLAAAPFRPSARSWSAQALADSGVAVEIVALPEDVRAAVVAAQTRQYR
jgi:hypothetical protein